MALSPTEQTIKEDIYMFKVKLIRLELFVYFIGSNHGGQAAV